MSSQWRNTTLGPLIKLATGKLDVNASADDGAFPFFTCARETFRIDVPAFDAQAVIVAGNGDLNVKYYEGKFNAYQRTYILTSTNEAELLPRFLFLFMDSYIATLRNSTQGSTIKYLKKAQFTGAPITLPPLEEQRRIVDVIESVDTYIAALEKRAETARTARSALLHDLLSNPDKRGSESSAIPFEEFAQLRRGHDLPTHDRVTGDVPVVASNGTVGFHDKAKADPPGVVTGRSGTIGRVIVLDRPYWPLNTTLYVTDFKGNVPAYVAIVLEAMNLASYAGGSTVPSLDRKVLNNVIVQRPSPRDQKKIAEVAASIDVTIDQLQKSVSSTRILRAALLSDLLSGNHEIPASYDELLGAA